MEILFTVLKCEIKKGTTLKGTTLKGTTLKGTTLKSTTLKSTTLLVFVLLFLVMNPPLALLTAPLIKGLKIKYNIPPLTRGLEIKQNIPPLLRGARGDCLLICSFIEILPLAIRKLWLPITRTTFK